MADDASSFTLVVLFNTAAVLSFTLIATIVATAYFSKYVRRRKVWYGQKAQWMIYCISYMLLFGFQKSIEPPRSLCLLQAAFIYACPPACAVGSACFIIDFYMSLDSLHLKPTKRLPRLELLLIVLPWAVLVLAALQVVLFVIGSGNLDSTQRSPGTPFCNISHPEPTIVSAALVLLAVFVWFYFEVQSGIIIYQNRLEFERLNYKTAQRFVSIYIRSAIFTVGMLIAIGLSIYCLSRSRGMGTWSVSLPFMPMFVAIVFGSQRDIMRVWIFWRKRTPEEEGSLSTSQLALTLDEVAPRKSIQIV